MKITGLQIDSYRHLQNLTFDFTYPEGHAKFGQPLEKICIIGQSATGKTGLLELVKASFAQIADSAIVDGKNLAGYLRPDFHGHVEYLSENGSLRMEKDKVFLRGEKYERFQHAISSSTMIDLIPDKLRLLFITSDIISKEAINIFNQNPLDLVIQLPAEQNEILRTRKATASYIYKFTQGEKEELWLSLSDRILTYRKQFIQWAFSMASKGTVADVTKLSSEFNEWSRTYPNPLKEFAEIFNPILQKLNLEVDLVNTDYLVPIRSLLKDKIIPTSQLSTGTKSLLLSLYPVHELDTKDSIILIDEPERSLFPDIQIDLVDHYRRLAPDAQFIIATHSPFIAAAFEPEERFILYFDEQGNVAVRRGESPIGDDPNDMLRNDFKVSYYNQHGKDAYNKYRHLKQKMAAAPTKEKQNEILVEMSALGDKYNF